jgi:hypothetical protein
VACSRLTDVVTGVVVDDTDGVDTTRDTTVFVTGGWLGLDVGVVIGLLTSGDDTRVTAVLVVGDETP